MTKSKAIFITLADERKLETEIDKMLADIENTGSEVLGINSVLSPNGTVGVILLYKQASEEGC